MLKHSPIMNRVACALLIAALCNVGALYPIRVLAAEKVAEDVQLTGQMIVSGSVTVNDKKAVTGTTVFTNSKIAVACAKGNSAIVNLGRLGRIELTPGSKLMLKFVDGAISGDLLEGKAVVNSSPGVKVSINTPDGVIAVDGKDATVTPVNSQRGVRCVPAMPAGGSGSTGLSALSPGALAAILLGAGGAAAAGAAVASNTNTNAASAIIP